jgi:putative phage-type endonuclease
MLNFKRLDLEQGTEEWLAWRDDGTGASEVRTIEGKSKYKTRWQLWAEKLGIKLPDDFSKNPHVRRGNYFEPLVRTTVEQKFGEPIDVFCGEDIDHQWRKVSFDGVLRQQNAPVEIKCPYSNIGDDECTDDEISSSYQDLIDNGESSTLFQEYEGQLHYQIGMINATHGYLVFYFSRINKLKIFKVMRDERRIKEIFDAVDKFYLEHIKPAIAPEKDKIRDYYEPTDDELHQWDAETLALYQVLAEERKLKAALKEIKAEKDALTESLLSKAGGFKQLSLHALKINAVKGRETFDYKGYLNDKGIEISDDEKAKFTKVGKSSTRMSIIKDRSLLEEVENRVISNQRKHCIQALFGKSDLDDVDDSLFEDEYYV